MNPSVITVAPGAEVSAPEGQTLPPNPAPVRIVAQPEGSQIFLDDRLVGVSPVGQLLEPGTYRVRIEHPARLFGAAKYAPERQTLRVDGTDPRAISIELKPVFGTFEIRLERVSRAWLGVRSLERTDVAFRGSVKDDERVALPPGRYEVTWRAPDRLHRTPETVVWELRAGENRRLEAEFTLREPLRERFVRIPEGPARLGMLGEETTSHLTEYLIGKYEVSVSEYREFVQAAGHASPNGRGCNWGLAAVDDHPVNCISYEDAAAYSRWLSARYEGLLFRLPREEEWEKAARGADGNVYPWGDDWRWVANLCDQRCGEDWARPDIDDGFSRTAPRGSFENASPYGAYDMLGNVAEWCEGGAVRGGSYRDFVNNLQTYKPHASNALPAVGMRLVVVETADE